MPRHVLKLSIVDDNIFDRKIAAALGARVTTGRMSHVDELEIGIDAPTYDDAKKRLAKALELVVKLYGEGEEQDESR